MKVIVKSLPLLIKTSASICFVLIAAAALHQLQLGSESYARSNLVLVEIVSLGFVLLTCLLQLIAVPYYLYRKNWRHSTYMVISAVISFLCIFLAVSIDTETILYAT